SERQLGLGPRPVRGATAGLFRLDAGTVGAAAGRPICLEPWSLELTKSKTWRGGMRNLCAGGVAAAALVNLIACTAPQPLPAQDTTMSVPGVVPAQSSSLVPTPT